MHVDARARVQYIFDNRGGVVEGRNFTQWFIDEYMITNETLLHKNPTTGKPQVIGLGWLDDSMTPHGPTEEDRNYMADTGADDADMKTEVAAYKTSMTALVKKVLPMGGYWWQLMDGSGTKLAHSTHSTTPITPAQCKSILAGVCTAKPAFWNKMAMYNIGGGGKNLTEADLKQYTAEFSACASHPPSHPPRGGVLHRRRCPRVSCPLGVPSQFADGLTG